MKKLHINFDTFKNLIKIVLYKDKKRAFANSYGYDYFQIKDLNDAEFNRLVLNTTEQESRKVFLMKEKKKIS